MFTLRARIFVIISIVVFLVLATSIGLLWWGKKIPATISEEGGATTVDSAVNQPVVGGGIVPSATEGLVVKKPSSEAVEKNATKQLAKIFIERYGSYSTDSDYQNIKELQELVSSQLWADLSQRINTPMAGGFVGVTTRVIAATVSVWNKDKDATINLQVIQTEQRDGVESVLHKNVDVELIKTAGEWLVDKFKWVD
ncbi:MAG: hypothetical protein WCX97_02580 [Candidatus Magasanikbacteria bacterium]